MTRSEYIQWCKDRALEYVDARNLTDAWGSMTSDLNKHPDTQDHSAIQLGMLMLMGGQLSTSKEMRDFINGFN